jgi:hypothetical protein
VWRRFSVSPVPTSLALVLMAWLPVEAQAEAREPAGLERGSRVRVTYEDHSSTDGDTTRVVGRIDDLDTESLRLDIGSSTKEVPRDAVVRLERSLRPSRKKRGALIGFGLGFATFFTLSELSNNEGCFSGGHECGLDVMASAIGALPVAVVGAIVAPGEEWVDVPLSPTPAAAVSPGSEGFQLSVAPLVGRGMGVALVGSF